MAFVGYPIVMLAHLSAMVVVLYPQLLRISFFSVLLSRRQARIVAQDSARMVLAASPQRKLFRHVNLMTLLDVYTFETSSAQTSTSASRSFGPALLTYALYWPIKPHTTV